ncbi:peptide chain release factor H [Kordia sp.]|uniref:peptide chain release factor H n=1 Tax=Kordia sp. TaxID=1965332 RepID=UPI003B5AC4E2
MDNQFWVQISSGSGPEECCLAVKYLTEKLTRLPNYTFNVIELVATKYQNYKSVWLRATGDATEFKNHWQGSIQFIFRSPYRAHHQRKNWFVDVKVYIMPTQISWSHKEVQVKTARSSGAGGQHVNKVETAVSMVHIPTGITVQASEERSQFLNKKLAFARLDIAINAQNKQRKNAMQKQKWMQHKQLQLGNPVQVFKK